MNGSRARRIAVVAVAVAAGTAGLVAGGAPAGAAEPGATPPALTLTKAAPVAVAPAGDAAGAQTQTSLQLSPTWQTTATSLDAHMTVTIDARRLARIADVTFSDNCAVTDDVATCTDWLYDDTPSPGSRIGGETYLSVAAKDGVAPGGSATYTVSGTADGMTVTGGRGRVDIGGPAYDQAAPADRTGLAVGTVVDEPLAFTNSGDRPSASTVVLLAASPGLSLPQRFSNCAYSVKHAASRAAEAICTIPGTVLPGEGAHLATALRAKVGKTAYYTYLDSQIVPAGDPAVKTFAKGRAWTQGTGDPLALAVDTPGTATDAPAGDVALQLDDPASDYRITSLQADNTADFGVTGSTATGAQGDTVTMDFALTDHGPATLFNRGGDSIGLTVTPPPGTTVVGSSANCSPDREDDPAVTAHGPYDCSSASLIPSGATYDFSLTLRIDQVVPGARGTAAIAWSPDGSWRPAYDTDASDDSAALSLN